MLRKSVSKKPPKRAPRKRWTLRPEHGERVIMAWVRKPPDDIVEHFISVDTHFGPSMRRSFTLCYDGRVVHTWDAEVVYE